MPELLLGKRTRQEGDSADEHDTEPDDTPPSATQHELLPSISNVAAATLRYASKKLRPEQRDEVDAFLLVSTFSQPFVSCVQTSARTRRLDDRPNYLHACCP